MADLTEKQITAIRLARKALLRDDLDLDERWFVVGVIDNAFPLIESDAAPEPS